MGDSFESITTWRAWHWQSDKQKCSIVVQMELEIFKRTSSLWCKVVKSIHGIDPHLWHTSGKFGLSLRSPWISISKTWSNFGSLTNFKLGNGRNIFFWLDAWCSEVSLQSRFARLHQIASLPNGSVNDHWDSDIGSWNFSFWKQLKDEDLIFSSYCAVLMVRELFKIQIPECGLWIFRGSTSEIPIKALDCFYSYW